MWPGVSSLHLSPTARRLPGPGASDGGDEGPQIPDLQSQPLAALIPVAGAGAAAGRGKLRAPFFNRVRCAGRHRRLCHGYTSCRLGPLPQFPWERRTVQERAGSALNIQVRACGLTVSLFRGSKGCFRVSPGCVIRLRRGKVVIVLLGLGPSVGR